MRVPVVPEIDPRDYSSPHPPARYLFLYTTDVGHFQVICHRGLERCQLCSDCWVAGIDQWLERQTQSRLKSCGFESLREVTAKHACTSRMWLCMKWHGCMVYTERAETAAVSCGTTSHSSAVSTPLRWIFKNRAIKSYSLL